MNKIREVEKAFYNLFCEYFIFSNNLIKREDNILKDKYDNNTFEYCGQFDKDEFEKALKYQKDRNDYFIKFEGYERLENNFGLEEGITLTMLLKEKKDFKINKNLIFLKPSLNELIDLEVKHYKDIYGEDFCRRNMIRLYEKLNYLGAYLDNKLVGAIYYFEYEDYICMDGLLVDENYRHRYIASSLINEIINKDNNKYYFLHAEEDDYPKDIYLKLGFEIVDKSYEYNSTQIDKILI